MKPIPMTLIPPVRQDSILDVPTRRGAAPRVWTRSAIVRETTPADYSHLAELHKRNGLQTKSQEDWNHLWNQNPVCQRRKNIPMGWVLETVEGEIVGSIANIPAAYVLGGRQLLSASPCSWATDPSYRRYSMLLFDQVMKQSGIDIFICSTVSVQSETSLRFFRWTKVPVGRWDRSKFWVTSYRPFAKRALSLRSIPMAGALAYPMSAALFCRDRWTDLWFQGSDTDLEIQEQFEFDVRFDSFWQNLKDENRRTLLAVRDRASLTWHFGPSLSSKKACIVTFSKATRLVAYAIFQRQDVSQYDLKRLRLVDYQSLRGYENALEQALNLIVHKCGEQRVHIVEAIGYVPHTLRIRGRRAYHRPLDAWRYYYKANNQDLAEILSDARAWSPTCFDGDASL